MCEKECVKDYLPSVDVQATEGLMGRILLCMYAQEAYVSCVFMCLSTSNACWIIYNKFHVPSTIDNYAHKKYYYSNLPIHCLCLITGSLLNVIILDQTKFAPLHYHYNNRGYLSMLFSCFRVLLKVIPTNQRNSKMVLSKHAVKICMSYDPNKNMVCEKFFLTLSPMCLGSVVYCL